MGAPTQVVADIDHDHGPAGGWVNRGDFCKFCGERMRAQREAYRLRINAFSRAIRRAQIEVGISMQPDEIGKEYAQRYLRDLRDGRREWQRKLAAYDLLIEARNEAARKAR